MTAARPALSPLRRGRITASRLPALLGISPYVTPTALIRQMVREHFGDPDEFTGNIATEWGHRHEAEAIAEYELTHGIQVFSTGTGQQTLVHPKLDFFAATPDGVTTDRVVEAKAPWRALYTTITERPDYYAQVQLQMEVTDMPRADLVIWREDQPLLVSSVERDRNWFKARIPSVQKFMDELQGVIADPELHVPHREPLRDERTDDEWTIQSREWLELDFLIKQLEAARAEAATKLKTLSPSKSARGNGVDLIRSQRRGNIQYQKVLDELKVGDMDLEKYRGKTAEVATIRRVGGNAKEQA